MSKINFGEVHVGDKAKSHIEDCLKNNWVTMGPKVALLEEKWAKLNRAKHAVGTSSGTTANTAALMALYDLGAKRGDEVIVPALGFIANATAVAMAGLTPVFCDIELETLNIDAAKIEDCITPRTKAIMPITTMGKPYDVKLVKKICDDHKLILITDNCEGASCKVSGWNMEEYSHMSTVSMFSAHICFAVEFGMVTTNDPSLADLIKSIRSHGRKPNSLYFEHERMSGNFKPTDLHACIGLESVEDFWDNFNLRKHRFYRFEAAFKELEEYVWYTQESKVECNSPHGFAITLKDPKLDLKGLTDKFDVAGIQWKRNFGASPFHKVFDYLHLTKNYFPNAVYAGDNGIHWGVHRYMSMDDVDQIIEIVKGHFGK